MSVRESIEPRACAECGHLHYFGLRGGYGECPIDGCGCDGQDWAHDMNSTNDGGDMHKHADTENGPDVASDRDDAIEHAVEQASEAILAVVYGDAAREAAARLAERFGYESVELELPEDDPGYDTNLPMTCHHCGAQNGMGAVVKPRGPEALPICAKAACQSSAMRATSGERS